MLARRERSPDIRRGGFLLSDDGPPAALLKHNIAALEGQRSIARNEAGDWSPAVSARQPCARRASSSPRTSASTSAGWPARWDRAVGLERSGSPTQPPERRQDGCRGRRLDASAAAGTPVGSPSLGDRARIFSPIAPRATPLSTPRTFARASGESGADCATETTAMSDRTKRTGWSISAARRCARPRSSERSTGPIP